MHRVIGMQIVRLPQVVIHVPVLRDTLEMEDTAKVSPARNSIGLSKRSEATVYNSGDMYFGGVIFLIRLSLLGCLEVKNGCQKTWRPDDEHKDGGGSEFALAGYPFLLFFLSKPHQRS